MKENVLTLNQVLKNKKVVANIEERLQKDVSYITNDGTVADIIPSEVRPVIFKNALFRKEVYLLENIALDKETGKELYSYLQFVDSKGEIINPTNFIDDVWNIVWEILESKNDSE